MKKPLFSIITCTYNTAKFVGKNIESTKAQTLNDFEHIFIDGYSSDGTISLLQKYREQLPGKVVIIKQKPKGISKAMNLGAKKARGEIIIHLHSDDFFYDKNVLKYISNKFSKDSDLDWVYGKSNIVEEDGQRVGVFPSRIVFQIPTSFLLKVFNYIPHQTVFIKKAVFEKYGYFDEKLRSQMDWDMWLRISKKTKWEFVDRLICGYTLRKGAQSSGIKNREANKKNNLRVAIKHLNFIEMIPYRLFRVFINKYNKTHRY